MDVSDKFNALLPILAAHFGSTIASCVQIDGGSNNRVFRVTALSGDSRIVKFYYVDDRHRIDREFGILTYLWNHQKMDCVPRPYFRNDDLGCVVFEDVEGQAKDPVMYTRRDMVRLADVLVRLHAIEPCHVPTNFPPAFMAVFSLHDQSEIITGRIEAVEHALRGEVHPDLRDFVTSTRVLERVRARLARIRTDIGDITMRQGLPPEWRRLSPKDFGPHNTLFRWRDGDVVIIDWEYAGWDHPLAALVDFMNHDRSAGIPFGLKQTFLDTYFQRTPLSAAAMRPFHAMLTLNALEWPIIYLTSVLPEKLARLRFSGDGFDEEAYIALQLAKAQLRLEALDL